MNHTNHINKYKSRWNMLKYVGESQISGIFPYSLKLEVLMQKIKKNSTMFFEENKKTKRKDNIFK